MFGKCTSRLHICREVWYRTMVIYSSRFREEVLFYGTEKPTRNLASYRGRNAVGTRRKRMSYLSCNDSIVQVLTQKQRTRKTIDSFCCRPRNNWDYFSHECSCKSAQSLQSSRKHVWRMWIPSRMIRATWYGDVTINCSQWNQDRISFVEWRPSISEHPIAAMWTAN